MDTTQVLKSLELVTKQRESLLDIQAKYNEKCRELAQAEQTIKRLSGTAQVYRTPEKDIVDTLANHTRNLSGSDLLVVTSKGELYKVTGTKNSPKKHFIARLFKVSGSKEIEVSNSTELFRTRSFSNTISNSDDEYESWRKRRLLSKGKMSRRSGKGKSRSNVEVMTDFVNWIKEVFAAK